MKKRSILLFVAMYICMVLIGCTDTSSLEGLVATPIDKKEEYTPNSYSVYEEALNAANKLISDGAIFQSDIDLAFDNLQNSINALQPKADKTELIKKVEEAKEIKNEEFLPITFEALQTAIMEAEAIITDDNILESDVSNAIVTIDGAILNLEQIPDKTEMGVLLEEAKTFKEEKYTSASYNILQEAITVAQTAYDDINTAKKNVDEAITMLQAAKEGLAKSKNCVWEITVDLSLEHNDSIENEWSTSIKYDGEEKGRSFEITAKEGTKIKITGKAVEEDNSPDKGSGSITLKLQDGNSKETTFYVKENRGPNAGNKAEWEMVVYCVLIERV